MASIVWVWINPGEINILSSFGLSATQAIGDPDAARPIPATPSAAALRRRGAAARHLPAARRRTLLLHGLAGWRQSVGAAGRLAARAVHHAARAAASDPGGVRPLGSTAIHGQRRHRAR